MPDHDTILPPDSTTNTTLNSSWRIFLVAQLERYLVLQATALDDSDYDALDNLYCALFEDIYS